MILGRFNQQIGIRWICFYVIHE